LGTDGLRDAGDAVAAKQFEKTFLYLGYETGSGKDQSRV
jgi:hypothetical protein